MAQIILNLLDNQYTNVTVEIDPDLEAALRKAVSGAETKEEIRAALEEILGPGINFRLLGDGQKGDTAWNLILYPGNDPDAAGRSAFAEWNKVFAFLPKDGQYGTKIAMIETENGYAILVQATVDRAGSRDDDDDEPDEQIPALGYEKTGNTYKVYNSTGLNNVLFDKTDDDILTNDRDSGFAGITITLAKGETYTVSKTFTTSFKGILQGEDKASTTINITGNGLFAQIGEEGGTSGSNGTVQNITFDVQTTITDTYTDSEGRIYAGAVAGCNYGEITNCDVTIGSSYTIQAETEISAAFVGGLVGSNEEGGKISGCTVDGGTITGTGNSAHAGGLAGHNFGTIDGSCKVTDTSVSATATSTDQNSGNARAGGLVGFNGGIYAKVDGTYSGDGEISATATGTSFRAIAKAGGLVGDNGSNGTVTGTYSGSGTIDANANANATGTAIAIAKAGGLVGDNGSDCTVTGTYENKGSTITARAVETGENTYKYEASVPNSESSYTDTDGDVLGNMAYAGTKCGYDTNGQPSSHIPNP